MPRRTAPPVAAAVSFVDAINRQDLGRLAELMTDDHRLCVFGEPPLVGREQNRDAWNGYFTSFPDYVILPEQLAERDGVVAILGATTGSHLGLSDDEERGQSLIWLASVRDGRLAEWRLVEDTAEARQRHGFAGPLPPSPTAVTLCVLLWAAEGQRGALTDYEDEVLALLPDHGARLVHRLRPDAEPGQPDEVHLLEFPNDAALDAYLGDRRRTALASLRDEAIARTEIFRVEAV